MYGNQCAQDSCQFDHNTIQFMQYTTRPKIIRIVQNIIRIVQNIIRIVLNIIRIVQNIIRIVLNIIHSIQAKLYPYIKILNILNH